MGSDVWLTPPDILARLGAFDLDPCSAINQPWQTARVHYTKNDDGLSKKWFGRVWCNPPFGSEAGKWLEKLAVHGNGVALIPARTETKFFFRYVWDCASAVLFLRGRPHFYFPDGTRAPFNSGAPICLIGYGSENVSVLVKSGLGVVVRDW